MKAGLATSVVLHAALLGFGLLTLSAPSALEVADVESLPVDIIPIEEVTKIQQGEKTATVKEKPAPLPTKRPDIVPDAQKVGENTVDTEKPPTPEAKPKPVETAAAPPPCPRARAKAGREAEGSRGQAARAEARRPVPATGSDARAASRSRRSSPTRSPRQIVRREGRSRPGPRQSCRKPDRGCRAGARRPGRRRPRPRPPRRPSAR